MARQVKKPPKKAATGTGRVRKLTRKQARGKAKKEVKSRNSLPGSFRLTGGVIKFLGNHWKPLGGIVLVYLILNVVFASGISNVSGTFSNIKSDLDTAGGHAFWHAAGAFGSLVATAGASGSATGSALQSALFVIESLVIIWALRHLMAGQSISVKLSYYRAMTPLIPFLLVIAVIIIQLLPVSIGSVVMAAVSTSVFTSSTVATTISIIAFILLAAWSLYMVSASIFALYIVTLPETQPRQALRSARDLVRFRRLAVLRKVFFLPVFIVLVMAVIIIPLILWASFLVPYAFYILSMLAILFVHAYFYSLYRSLLE
jgi:hypothetical protein